MARSGSTGTPSRPLARFLRARVLPSSLFQAASKPAFPFGALVRSTAQAMRPSGSGTSCVQFRCACFCVLADTRRRSESFDASSFCRWRLPLAVPQSQSSGGVRARWLAAGIVAFPFVFLNHSGRVRPFLADGSHGGAPCRIRLNGVSPCEHARKKLVFTSYGYKPLRSQTRTAKAKREIEWSRRGGATAKRGSSRKTFLSFMH